MSTYTIDAPMPDLELDEILAIRNPEKLACKLNRHPKLDPRNPTVVKRIAELPNEYWAAMLRGHLADLEKLDTKALAKRHKQLQKVAVPLGNLFFDEEEEVLEAVHSTDGAPTVGVEALMSVADVAAVPEAVTASAVDETVPTVTTNVAAEPATTTGSMVMPTAVNAGDRVEQAA
jgi:hypothetical protein